MTPLPAPAVAAPTTAINWVLNILVRVQAIPEVVAKPVMINILIAIALHPTLGATALALATQHINTPAREPATPVAPVNPAAANTPPALAPAAMSGTVAAVFLKVLTVNCIIVTAWWSASVPRV